MFFCVFLQASIFKRQSCCSQSRPTNSAPLDCYVMHEVLRGLLFAASRIASRKITIRHTHTHLQHLFYFIANVWRAKIKENKCDIKVSSCNIYFYFILDAQFALDEQYEMAEIKYLCIYASTQI